MTREPGRGSTADARAEAAAGLGNADPQPGAEELGRVPAPVIRRIPGQPRHSGPHDRRPGFGPLRRRRTRTVIRSPGPASHRPCAAPRQPVAHPAAAELCPDPHCGRAAALTPGRPGVAVHGPGRDDCKDSGPGSSSHPGGEISSRPKIQQRSVRQPPSTPNPATAQGTGPDHRCCRRRTLYPVAPRRRHQPDVPSEGSASESSEQMAWWKTARGAGPGSGRVLRWLPWDNSTRGVQTLRLGRLAYES